ncbi:MAG: SGNH/GDSL hydrolase family protein [Candidatus Omnitrophota bacterium]
MFDLQNKKGRRSDTYVFPAEIKMSPDAEEWRGKGRACERDGKYDETISWYKKIVEKYPSALGGYDCLRSAYYMTRNREEERRMFKKLIELDPQCLKFLIKTRTYFLADPVNDKEDLEFIKRYEHINPIAADILKKVAEREKYRREMQGWINHDIEEMIRRAHRRGIKVILQAYPDYENGDRYENHSFINEGLRETAKKSAVLFIDNERLFDQMFLKGENRDDYFEPAKVHCNEKGYGVMAKNIYCGIIASNGLGILPDVDPAEKSECLDPN